MRIIKNKYILSLFVFLIGMSVLTGTVCSVRNNQREQNQAMANLNAMTYAERMKNDVMKGIGVTDTLEQILISEDGKIDKFYTVAQDIMTEAIQSIQIAPNGVVTDIYPDGNDAGKIDLINDSERGEICRYSRDNHILTMQGPFKLKQGGYGMAVRNPVYLENESGEKDFWGFTIVIIRVPEIFSDSIKALSEFGYQYRVLKTVSPWDSDYEVVYSSGGDIIDPVSYSFDMGGNEWKLEVMPQKSWYNSRYLYEVLFGGMVIVLLLTGLTVALLILDENRRKFEKLAVTDALTGLYNRHGFDKLVAQYLKQHPNSNCVEVQLDIDDFKFINDMYGHAAGDIALQVLAQSMQSFFPKNAILGRNGGDEFCIFIPDITCEQVNKKMNYFTKLNRVFIYDGEEHTFSISLGYAEYPLHASNASKLIKCADAALYEIKLRGKNGCIAYENGFGVEIRTQLGFTLKDISENLPGAFIIYKANKNDDEILFANREFVKLAGYKNVEDLLASTNKSFYNLIKQDERENVQEDIWKQIESGDFNNYVHFHLKKQDGSFIKVLNHGRIVENSRYGSVFYVMIADWESYKNSL